MLDGRSRVDGLALGASGIDAALVDLRQLHLARQRGAAERLDFCLANPGSAGCTNTAASIRSGDPHYPDSPPFGEPVHQLPFSVRARGSATDSPIGARATHQRNALQRTQYFADDFLIHRLFAAYEFGNGLTAQLNLQNLTDERYFTNIRNNVNATTGAITGNWAVPGEARSAVLSLFYSF